MGRYLPFARLGTGGMADVFLTMAQGTHGVKKLTVVKRLRNSGDDSLVQMFLDEARLSARLNHANIVQTYEVGEERGDYFIAMEYLEGQPLSAVLKELRLSGRWLLSDTAIATIGAEVLKGLHYAHEFCDFDGSPLGIVHRDVSPHNIFVTYSGHVKVLDFGIAKTAMESTRTETGVLKGKLGYMAPEQAMQHQVDRRVDIFAVGVVLWEMLTRHRLFRGDPAAVLHRIVHGAIPAPSTLRPDIPPVLEAIVMKALERDRDQRFNTAEDMRVELERIARSSGEVSSDAELGWLMRDLFATTRETVRARIQAYIAQVGAGPAVSSSQPIVSRELPILDLPSNATVAPSETGGATPDVPLVQGSGLARWAFAVGLSLAVAAAMYVFVLPRYRVAPPSSSVSVLPAQVRVETTPEGALVQWNGKFLGRTPVAFSLEPGVQNLVLSRDGYELEVLTIDAKSADTLVRAVSLRAKAVIAPAVSASASASASTGAARPQGPPAHFRVAQPAAAVAAPPASKVVDASAPRPKIRIIDEGSP